MIVARHYLADLESKETPVPAGGRNRDGYGRKIPTRHMVKLPGSPRWRRVYCCCYSNVGTCYVATPAGWIVIC